MHLGYFVAAVLGALAAALALLLYHLLQPDPGESGDSRHRAP
jgi:hypothetical protein